MEFFDYTLRYYDVSYSWRKIISRFVERFEGRNAVRDSGSKRELWFRGWIGQSYENAVGYWLPCYTMSFKENPFTAEPVSGPCPRYSNGSHSYRANCRYCRCYWQDPIIPWADIVTWKRWQLPIHFSDVFISSAYALTPRGTIASSKYIVRSTDTTAIKVLVWLLIQLSRYSQHENDSSDFSYGSPRVR